MNKGPEETRELVRALKKELQGKKLKPEILICPPMISVYAAGDELSENPDINLGAQNMHFEDNGAFTGETSATMLREVGCRYVIIGHSERRQYFGETDETVNKKILKALSEGLKPIVCVGETLEERKKGEHKNVVKRQVNNALKNIPSNQINKVVIAYEPVWAIGTGETATPEQAQAMHAFIRNLVEGDWGKEVSSAMRILYGGSMKPANAAELLRQEDVDGGLIGGASLKANLFAEIIETANARS